MKHPLLALVAAPFLGALFAVFLPFIGFVLLAEAIYRRATRRKGERTKWR